VRSVGGKWYVLVTVDDFSRYAWVYYLKTKDEVFGLVRNLILRLKNERPYDPIRAIRSDNGTKIKNAHFAVFYHDHGLEHHFSSPHVPPQNGFVERKNRTLVEMARTVLDEHRTPRKYWAKAINTACYISNRIFLRALLKKSSYELMHRRAPKVSHLRSFGCRCFILIQGNLDKFESCSSDGLFLGYANHSRAYCALNLETNRIVETNEMTFDESIPCANGGFELAGDDEFKQSIFKEDIVVDAGVEAEDVGVDHQPVAEPPVTASSTLVEGPTTTPTTSSLHQVFWDEDTDDDQVAPAIVEGEATSEPQAPQHIEAAHPPQQMISYIHEHTTRHSSRISHFVHSAFVASFEPRDIGHAFI
jgi:hypothetical protein